MSQLATNEWMTAGARSQAKAATGLQRFGAAAFLDSVAEAGSKSHTASDIRRRGPGFSGGVNLSSGPKRLSRLLWGVGGAIQRSGLDAAEELSPADESVRSGAQMA
jgi:hypothetical protein